MSSEVNTPADLSNCPKTSAGTKEDMESEDLCMTQSSILHLLQEATKLVTPPGQDSLDAEQLQESTKETNFINTEHNSQEVGAVQTQPSFTGAFSMRSNSPWEAMSLINLQCERLLQSGEPPVEEDLQVHKTETDTKTEDKRSIQEWQSVPSTVSTSPVSLMAGANEYAMESDASCSVPYITDPPDHRSSQSISENSESDAESGLSELISKTREDGLRSSRLIPDDMPDQCSFSDTSVLPLDLTKKVEIYEHSIEGEGDDEMAGVSVVSDAAPSSEVSSDVASSLVAEKSEEPRFSFNIENVTHEHALMSETSPSRKDLNNNMEDEVRQEAEKTRTAISAQATCSNRRRTPRKQAHPARSPDLNDPGLQGVAFTMHTELEKSTDQCHLHITPNYSKLCGHSRRSRSSRSRSLRHSQQTSSSGDESDLSIRCEKTCASCCTRKTPLWRDAEDGTPLCNACGIRYKKYGVRCLQCWNIPRKEANFTAKCLKCGELLPLLSQGKRAGF